MWPATQRQSLAPASHCCTNLKRFHWRRLWRNRDFAMPRCPTFTSLWICVAPGIPWKRQPTWRRRTRCSTGWHSWKVRMIWGRGVSMKRHKWCWNHNLLQNQTILWAISNMIFIWLWLCNFPVFWWIWNPRCPWEQTQSIPKARYQSMPPAAEFAQ